MIKRLIIVFAVLSFIFLGTAFSAVENIKVSGDMNNEVFTRDLTLGGADYTTGLKQKADESLFSQIRLRFDADLSEGVSAVLRLISEEGWGERGTSNNLKVDLGYVEMKEFLYQPLTVIIGKQELHYGNGMIVGNTDTNQGKITGSAVATNLPNIVSDLSLLKSFDAVRAILDFSPWTLDFVFAQVDEGNTNDRRDDEMLLGFNAAYSLGSHGEVAELYFFSGDNTPQAISTDAKDKVYVTGARTLLNLSEKITVGIEGAYQFGDYRESASIHRHIAAWAGQFISEYRFLNAYNAKVGLDFSYFSGDKSNISRYEAWNPMWEDQSPAELMNTLLSMSNRKVIGLSASMMPREDVTLKLRYARGWLDKKFTTALINPAIGPASGYVYYVEQSKKHLGDEIDLYALYDYTEDVQFKVSGAWLVPGTVFSSRNDNLAYSVRAGVNVEF